MAEIISKKVQDLPVASSRENLEIPGFDTSTNAAAKLTAEQLVGSTGVTPDITISAESIPNGQEPTVTKTGTNENPNFLFGIPLAKDGENAPTPITQYSADGSSWHYGYQTGDNYYRMSYDNGSTWNNAIPTNQGVIASGGIADSTTVSSIHGRNLIDVFNAMSNSSRITVGGDSVTGQPAGAYLLYDITRYTEDFGVINAYQVTHTSQVVTYTKLNNNGWSSWLKVKSENSDTEWRYEYSTDGNLEVRYRKNKVGIVELHLQANDKSFGRIQLPSGFTAPEIGAGSGGGSTNTYVVLQGISSTYGSADGVVVEINGSLISQHDSFGQEIGGTYIGHYTYEPID